jgi:hypothetical protein
LIQSDRRAQELGPAKRAQYNAAGIVE